MTAELIIEQLGKFHLITLHFPIALAALAPVVMVLGCFNFGKFWIPTIPYFIHVATLSAIVVVPLGLLLAFNRGELEGALWWHRALGIAAGVLLILSSLYLLVKKPDLSIKIPALLWVLVVVSAVTTGMAGHLGGESVHGSFIILGDDF